jgi:hypothetical protein
MAITRSGTNGLKFDHTFSFSDGTTANFSEIYDYESSEIKIYSPICE